MVSGLACLVYGISALPQTEHFVTFARHAERDGYDEAISRVPDESSHHVPRDERSYAERGESSCCRSTRAMMLCDDCWS